MPIVSYNAPDVPKRYHKRLKELTLGVNGLMWDTFLRTLDESHPGRVHMYFHGRRLVGWALRFKSIDLWTGKPLSNWNIYVFVDEKYRRRGFASQLTAQSTRPLPRKTTVVAYPWDERSTGFWEMSASKNKRLDLEYMD